MSLEENEQGRILLQIARAAICRTLQVPYPVIAAVDEQAAWLSRPGATFVTLFQRGKLRGCIGSLQACDPLIEDVSSNAISAAIRDPRFSSLTANELDSIRMEVSLLSTVQPLHFTSEVDALAKLRPGIDGVIFEYGFYRSTFLPQVWESFPEPRQFLANLKVKAGLSENFWADGIKLSCYSVSKWREVELNMEHTNG